MPKVHLKHALEPARRELLRAHLDTGVQLSFGVVECPADFEILVEGFPTLADLAASPRLRAVIVPWAGVPLETIERLKQFPRLTLHNLPYNAAPTAETALALLLATAKKTVQHDRAFRRHLWTLPAEHQSGSVLLAGGTALILGYGRIGERLAKACRSFGMGVIAVRRTPHGDPPDQIFGPHALPDLLPKASAVLVCLPHTPETTGFLGRRELALLSPQAILVNVARGPIVDEEALYQALKAKRIFGAGLDVWYHYPTDSQRESRIPCPPSRFPFHELDNVVMSPHRAGWSEETEIDRCLHLAELLNAVARNEPLPYRVDLERGY